VKGLSFREPKLDLTDDDDDDNDDDDSDNIITPWHLSANEIYRPSERLLSAKLAQTFADRGRRVVRATDTNGRIFGLLDQNQYYLIALQNKRSLNFK
jgi:hypothetical protein